MEETNEIKKLNVEQELEKINSKTIFEFKKTIDNFEIEKIKVYQTKDDVKTIDFLFYDNDFFAVNRINYKEGYEFYINEEVSENLNYKIRKIPNVAKTRKILNIDDIEARIYDVSEYILLLKKEDIKILKVNNQDNISDMNFSEYTINKENVENQVYEYELAEEEEYKKQRSLKNKVKKFADKVRYVIVEPFKILRNKLIKANEIKMLSDGKHSIFDKQE